ncbi:hypothetical protein SDC9_101797 [bioreactor metagenome]|uniref:Uncharacterized protein n=1 Tax=bioreactor metagenome TaxID=1076179 RepID=A0A645AP30_9ZZZZ
MRRSRGDRGDFALPRAGVNQAADLQFGTGIVFVAPPQRHDPGGLAVRRVRRNPGEIALHGFGVNHFAVGGKSDRLPVKALLGPEYGRPGRRIDRVQIPVRRRDENPVGGPHRS